MIFNERHTDDDTLLLIPALYSTDISKLYVSIIEEKKKSCDMFEEAGFLVQIQEVTYEDLSHEWTHTMNLYCT